MLPNELPCILWDVVNAYIYMINYKMFLCIVDYYSKFPVVKKVSSLAIDGLAQMTEMIFVEYGFPKQIISDAGTNVTSEIFKQFWKQMSILQSITSSYHHQSNSQVEACIKVVVEGIVCMMMSQTASQLMMCQASPQKAVQALLKMKLGPHQPE